MYLLRFGSIVLACGALLTTSVQPTLARHASIHTSIGCGGGPSVVQIGNEMSRTVEASHTAIHFTAASNPVTVQDGHGSGTVTAIIGRRFPGANGHGQLVFFWHGTTFEGWDTKFENRIAKISSANQGSFTITYNGTFKVDYAWSSNHFFISDGVPPGQKSGGITVRRLP